MRLRHKGAHTDSRPRRWEPAPSSVSAAPQPSSPQGFASTEHLSPEAIVALVDHELTNSALRRAQAHLDVCPDCLAEVNAQTAARAALRSCHDVKLPEGLLCALAQIPTREIDLRRSGRRGR